eukprot:CAMPEP_0182526218 /NCGR_PEP_ID=MMETSP1323-20130603/3026_1 /TAXON_ID=236787 /ORGANISM="Florenciella parvula, Strain RCC1693" /LENGTH=101 /DNA_ID=CAMNT_0024735035 /DNA_START=461 /DNA_END=762 /DNA_ORIENTATION=-
MTRRAARSRSRHCLRRCLLHASLLVQLNLALEEFRPLNVRLVRHKDTGESRGFAFVDFASVHDSMSFVERHSDPREPGLKIDGHVVKMEYTEEGQSNVQPP